MIEGDLSLCHSWLRRSRWGPVSLGRLLPSDETHQVNNVLLAEAGCNPCANRSKQRALPPPRARTRARSHRHRLICLLVLFVGGHRWLGGRGGRPTHQQQTQAKSTRDGCHTPPTASISRVSSPSKGLQHNLNSPLSLLPRGEEGLAAINGREAASTTAEAARPQSPACASFSAWFNPTASAPRARLVGLPRARTHLPPQANPSNRGGFDRPAAGVWPATARRCSLAARSAAIWLWVAVFKSTRLERDDAAAGASPAILRARPGGKAAPSHQSTLQIPTTHPSIDPHRPLNSQSPAGTTGGRAGAPGVS